LKLSQIKQTLGEAVTATEEKDVNQRPAERLSFIIITVQLRSG